MAWAAKSPNPQIKPELITCVFTGWTAKHFWYHFHNLNISFSFLFFSITEKKKQPRKKYVYLKKDDLKGDSDDCGACFYCISWIRIDQPLKIQINWCHHLSISSVYCFTIPFLVKVDAIVSANPISMGNSSAGNAYQAMKLGFRRESRGWCCPFIV